MRTLLLSAFSFLLFGCQPTTNPSTAEQKTLPEGIVLLKEHKVKAKTAGISYQKYRLKNGLTLVLHQDKSDPLVHVDMTYHVGSAREIPGQSGFAHFFEHMMFQGSKHVADQQHIKLMTESGGEVNGTTNRDRTNYYQTAPANQLEKILWLESDRMGFLLDAISQKKFEIQRDTIKNERAQNYDNRPYGLVSETLSAAMFPAKHPYSWPTIGYFDELNNSDLSDLKNFFLRWYGTNNATLTIGGDIDIAQTLEWVDKYFSEIPAGPEVAKNKPMPVALDADRFVTLEDKITQPLLIMSWPTEHSQTPSNMALEMLATVLGQGRTSLLYQALVKTGKALSVSASQNCGELACAFKISVLGNQGQNLNELYQLVQLELAKLVTSGVDKNKLSQIKSMAESEAIFSLESVHGKVAQLAINQTFYDDPDRLQLWLDKLSAVTPKQVLSALNEYILSKPKVVLSVVPKGKTELASQKANYVVTRAKASIENNENNENKEKSEQISSTLYARETPITFERSQIPKPQYAVNVKVPTLYRAKLQNDIELVGTYMNETPTVGMHLLFPAGKTVEPADKIGLASLTARMIREGSTKNSSEEIESKLDYLGSSVSLYSSTDSSILSISSLSKNLPKTLKIAEEILFEPRFNEVDFQRLKKQTIEQMQLMRQSSQWLAQQAKRTVLYQDPWRRLPMTGSVETINNITLDDVKAFYQQNYTPNKARIIVVGDIKQKKAVKALASFGSWKGGLAKKPAPMQINTHSTAMIWLVDKPEAPQSIIQFVRHGLPLDAIGDMFKLQLANFPLGGNFNSRLNLNLREDKGYTYGAQCQVVGGKDYGSIEIATNVRANSTIATITEIQNELERMVKNGIGDDELAFMRLAIGEKKALMYETPGDKANLISYMMRYQLPEDFNTKQQAILANITKDELDALAKKWFSLSDFQIIVVGDAKTLKPELEKLGLPVNDLAL